MIHPVVPGTNSPKADQLLEELYVLKHAIPVIQDAFNTAVNETQKKWISELLANCKKGLDEKITTYHVIGGDLPKLVAKLLPRTIMYEVSK